MAYNKTTWVNNTTPIDETNLNKIEQGIYDNSLVTDIIKPTGETYKSQTITEGQITDVIGVSNILIKGQTSQNGEPTPSSPVDVNVVSGSNVINTSNKNLFDGEKIVNILPGGQLTIKKIDSNNFTLFGNVDSQFYLIFLGKVKKLKGKNLYFKCTISKALAVNYAVISCNSSGEDRNNIFTLNVNGNVLSGSGTIGNNIDENLYVAVRLYATGTTFPGSVTYTNVQVHYGTTETTYEPHQGKELPLDLPVENLFDSTLNTNTIGGVSINYNNDGSITLNGTATSDEMKYVFSKYPSGTSMCKLKANTSYTASMQKTSGTGVFNGSSEHSSIQFWQPWNYSFQMFFDDILKSDNTPNQIIITKTPTQETDLKNIQLSIRSGDVFNNFTIRVQFEQSSKANAYTPYGTEPIELCKIGDYQDYFYKSGSKWYLHKEVEKIVLNGTENWIDSISQSGGVALSGLLSSSPDIALSNILKYQSGITAWTEDGKFGFNSSGVLWCKISNTINSLNDWKAYLNSNNMIIYYHKYPHIDTEITDTTLISQLEAIYNAPLYEQTNITQENNDLPMVLDITACKDNINGIKAFIRK